MPRPPPSPDPAHELHRLVSRNVKVLLDARVAHERRKSRTERIVDAVTAFTGSLMFVLVHAAAFGGWILVNLGALPLVRPWDPFPFVMLAMIAAVEAIFLSTFVLISQNRMAAAQDRRADLDLQINLLAEYEVTKVLTIADAIARRLGVVVPEQDSLEILKQDVAPEVVLAEIAVQEARLEATGSPASERT